MQRIPNSDPIIVDDCEENKDLLEKPPQEKSQTETQIKKGMVISYYDGDNNSFFLSYDVFAVMVELLIAYLFVFHQFQSSADYHERDCINASSHCEACFCFELGLKLGAHATATRHD